ncbi:uncharacterized protein [Spinacia oleracea]|uniref:Uncharacterized protein n=1 Tax=Spinacia oleracea TaxID=3562 RepID=A0ABM3QQY2_SPIOL|nr:uncharacterized protein LOC130461632 [Spinacia oleracea]
MKIERTSHEKSNENQRNKKEKKEEGGQTTGGLAVAGSRDRESRGGCGFGTPTTNKGLQETKLKYKGGTKEEKLEEEGGQSSRNYRNGGGSGGWATTPVRKGEWGLVAAVVGSNEEGGGSAGKGNTGLVVAAAVGSNEEDGGSAGEGNVIGEEGGVGFCGGGMAAVGFGGGGVLSPLIRWCCEDEGHVVA